jgi:Leucine-rich repeat (LRR) protein
MRTYLWALAIGLLAAAAGCLFDTPRQHGITLPTTPPRTAKEQRDQYIASIRKAGGQVSLMEDDPERPVLRADFDHIRLTPYTWDILGPWDKVQDLNLYDTGCTDKDLKRLQQMPNLQVLNLNNNKITDAGLSLLQGLRHLHSLYLNQTQITDAGLERLRPLSNLRNLELLETRVTDAGLICLLSNPNLEKLTLGGPTITDRSLETFKSLRKLRELTLVNSGVSPSGVEEVKLALPHTRVYTNTH